MMKRYTFSITARFALSLLSIFLFTTALQASTLNFGPISVPGNSVIFDPDNIVSASDLALLGNNGGLGAVSAVEALTFGTATGQTFTFSATGLVGCCGSAVNGPDGNGGSSNINSYGSISGFVAPAQMALVGVFTDGSPIGSAPVNYDYSGGVGQSSFSPLLNQVFFVGDGLTGTGSGTIQIFNVPSSATELWLGIADAFAFVGPVGWYGDNPGSLSVSGTLTTSTASVPEPTTMLLLGLGLVGLVSVRRKFSN